MTHRAVQSPICGIRAALLSSRRDLPRRDETQFPETVRAQSVNTFHFVILSVFYSFDVYFDGMVLSGRVPCCPWLASHHALGRPQGKQFKNTQSWAESQPG